MKIIDRKFLNVDTKSCHAGTVAFYRGKPVFAWFGGTREGAQDSSIYIQYEGEVIVFGDDGMPKWNPILFPYGDKLFLFIKAGIFCDRWQTFILDISDIYKKKFDIAKIPIQILPAGLNGPVKTKPVVKNGIIYCGSSVETTYDWTSYIETYMTDDEMSAFLFANRTHPLSVAKVQYKDSYGYKKNTCGIIQPSLWIDKNGKINAFFRSSRGLGKIYYSKSPADNLGLIWDNPKATLFENPNSGVDTVFMNDRLFLVHNPSADFRYPLIISELSEEPFETVDKIVITESIPDNEKTNTPELSYPYMIENEGKLHLVYTYGRSKIEHVVIEV